MSHLTATRGWREDGWEEMEGGRSWWRTRREREREWPHPLMVLASPTTHFGPACLPNGRQLPDYPLSKEMSALTLQRHPNSWFIGVRLQTWEPSWVWKCWQWKARDSLDIPPSFPATEGQKDMVSHPELGGEVSVSLRVAPGHGLKQTRKWCHSPWKSKCARFKAKPTGCFDAWGRKCLKPSLRVKITTTINE